MNDFTEGNDDADLEILRITNDDERKQVGRLESVRASRDDATGPVGPRGVDQGRRATPK